MTLTEPSNVTFLGNITVNKNETFTGWVNLTAHVFYLWPVTVSPSTIEVGPGRQLKFHYNATVAVPAGARVDEPNQLTVTARLDLGGVPCNASPALSQAIVRVKPAYGPMLVRADPAEVWLTTRQQHVAVAIDITQEHNFNATLQRDLAGYPLKAGVRVDGPAGLSFDAPTTVSLSQVDNRTVHTTLLVNFSFEATGPGDHELTILVWSAAQGAEFAGTATVVVHASGPFVDLQLYLGLLFGGTAVTAFVFWLWRERPKTPIEP